MVCTEKLLADHDINEARCLSFWRPYLFVLTVIAVGMAVPVWRRGASDWSVFVLASRRLLDGQDFYPWRDGFVYPPFSALLALPFSAWNPLVSRLCWYFICVACLIVLVRVSWILGGGSTSNEKIVAKEHAVFLLGCAAALRFAANALSHLQIDLLIDALLVVGCLAVISSRFSQAAICWGLGAACKGPPLLMVVYFILHKKFVPALLMLVVAISANVLPNVVSSPPNGELWGEEWLRTYMKPFGRDDTPGKWYNIPLNNQSIAGAVSRWLTTKPGIEDRLELRVPGPSLRTVKIVDVLANAMLFFGAIALFALNRDVDSTGGNNGEVIQREVVECSVLLLSALLLSPMSSRSHFGIMLLPAFCVARGAVYAGDRALWIVLILTILASAISFNTPFTRYLCEMSKWFGAVMFCAIFLLCGCARLLLRPDLRRATSRMQACNSNPSPQPSV